jgi:hypothetical protein
VSVETRFPGDTRISNTLPTSGKHHGRRRWVGCVTSLVALVATSESPVAIVGSSPPFALGGYVVGRVKGVPSVNWPMLIKLPSLS